MEWEVYIFESKLTIYDIATRICHCSYGSRVLCITIYVRTYLSFIIAFAFAYLINPVVNFLNQKLQFPRALAVLVSLILVFGAIVGLVTYLVTEAISATTYLLQTCLQ